MSLCIVALPIFWLTEIALTSAAMTNGNGSTLKLALWVIPVLEWLNGIQILTGLFLIFSAKNVRIPAITGGILNLAIGTLATFISGMDASNAAM